MAGAVDPFDEVKTEVEAAVAELVRNGGLPARCESICVSIAWVRGACTRDDLIAGDGASPRLSAPCRVRLRGLQRVPAAWEWPSMAQRGFSDPAPLRCDNPRSKVQEAVEQIEFDLGMLDESIER